MSLGKKDIARNISTKAHISHIESKQILSFFIDIIQRKSKNNSVKISKFGTFFFKKSPERIGRNPQTKEEYKICKRQKLHMRTSSFIKQTLN